MDHSDLDPSTGFVLAPALANMTLDEPKRPKSPPIIDEDGFEMVKPKAKGKRRGGANKGGGETSTAEEGASKGGGETMKGEEGASKAAEGASNGREDASNEAEGVSNGVVHPDKNVTVVNGDTNDTMDMD